MSRRRNPFRLALLGLLFLIPAAAVLALQTETGLQWTARLLERQLEGLQIEAADGRLAGPFRLHGVRWQAEGQDIRLARLDLDWRPLLLVREGRLVIESLKAEGIRVEVERTTPPAPAAPREPLELRLPVAAEVGSAVIRDVRITIDTGEPVIIEEVRARLHGHGRRLAINDLELRAAQPAGQLRGSARLPLAEGGRVHIDLAGAAELDGHRVEAQVAAAGTTRQLDITARTDAPIAARLEGQLRLEDAPSWEARVEIEPVGLADLLPEAPDLGLGPTRVEASGSLEAARATAVTALAWDVIGTWDLDVTGRFEGGRWAVDRLLAAERGGSGRIRARAHQQGAAFDDLSARAEWTALVREAVALPDGRVTFRGTPDAWAFTAEGAATWGDYPRADLSAAGKGGAKGVTIDPLDAHWLGGRLSGRAEIAWDPALGAEIDLGLENLDPGQLQSDLGGELNARLRATMRSDEEDRATVRLQIEDVGGAVAGLPIRGRGLAELDTDLRGGLEATLSAGDVSLNARARLGEVWEATWALEAPDVSSLAPGIHARIQARGTHRGPPAALENRVRVQIEELGAPGVFATSVSADLEATLGERLRWAADVRAEGVETGGIALGQVRLRSRGTPAEHALTLRTRAETLHLDQTVRGRLHDGRWEGELRDGVLVQADIGTWTQRAPTALHLGRDGAAGLRPMCWDSFGASLCGAFQSRPGDPAAQEASLEWAGLELGRLATLLALDTIELSGMSTGRAQARRGADGLEADVSARAESGRLSHPLPGDAGIQTLAYRRADLRAVADAEGVHAEATLTLTNPDGSVTATASLPGYTPTARPAPDQPLAARANADFALSADSLFIPDVHLERGGRALLDLRLSGTAAAPELNGDVALHVDRLSLLPLGTRIEALHLDAQIRENTIALSGEGRMGEGTLALGGHGDYRRLGDWDATLRLTGTELDMVRIPTAQITASPEMALHVTPRELRFDGRLEVPRARLEPIRPESAVTPSEDVVTVSELAEADEEALEVRGRLEFILGDDVRVSGRGFDGRLAGRLALVTTRDRLAAQGEIDLVDGRYRAYGQNLVIRKGRVLYAGGPVDNPAIDVTASRMRGENNDIEVGVRVMGTAQMPTVELYSSPAMDDADVLSWLILGRPLSEAHAGEGADLYQAATSVAIAGGGALAEKIGERFNLVEVSIEAGEQTEDTALVLGRSLSPRLYVRYIQGLMDDTNAIQFRYRLGEHWTLETESGSRTGAGADLLYTLER